MPPLACHAGNLLTMITQFLNGAGNSPKDRVALSIIQMVSSNRDQTYASTHVYRPKRRVYLYRIPATPSMKVL